MSADTATPVAEAARFELTTSRQFTTWLADTGLSIALSTYQSGSSPRDKVGVTRSARPGRALRGGPARRDGWHVPGCVRP